MEIKKDYDLTKLNTFGVTARAKFFAELRTEQDLSELLALPEFRSGEKMFLGGGSNVLFTRDFGGFVVQNSLKGIEMLEDAREHAVIRAMGGEIWHNLVEFAAARGLWGIENLSLIPGSVGAAPMQNIGAYGAELKQSLVSVEACELATGAKKVFSAEECALGYRDSIFKNKLKGKYFIYAVTLKLFKAGRPNTSYKVLKDYLEQNKIEARAPKDISDAVAAIRRSKLPDPKVIGNAGSFFKNVFVSEAELSGLRKKFPDIPHWDDGDIKIPAAWLIEAAGWKGRRLGRVGVHDRQALVLVNHGNATGQEILDLARAVIASVKEKFGLTLHTEVNIV